MDNKFGTSLIDCIKQFELGKITLTNTTSKKIYLSNGESFNQHLWYQAKNIYNYIMKDLVSGLDSSVAENLKYRENLKIKNLEMQLSIKETNLRNTLNEVSEKQAEYDNLLTQLQYDVYSKLKFVGEQMFENMTFTFPFGKFHGQRVCDVYKTDPRYVIWIFKNVDKYLKIERFYYADIAEDVLHDPDALAQIREDTLPF